MTDEQTNTESVPPEIIERRSLDPEMIFQGMTATGILTGGIGTLGLGVSKVKETFGNKPGAETQATPEPPKNES
jgi:hypothetical protein